jgi:hypothetical protein
MCVAQLKFRDFLKFMSDVVSVVCGVWCVLHVFVDTVTRVMDGTWKYDGGQVEQLLTPNPQRESRGYIGSELPTARNSGN